MKILLGLFFAVSLYAETPKVIYVEGLNHFSGIEKMVMHAQKYFKAVGLVVRVQLYQIDEILCPNDNGDNRILELSCLEKFANRNFKRKKTIIYNFLNGGWIRDNRKHFGGIAKEICTDMVLSGASMHSYPTELDSIEAAADISVHEIFHAMCATHTDVNVPSIMAPVIWRNWKQANGLLPILPITKRQVKRWYSKVRK